MAVSTPSRPKGVTTKPAAPAAIEAEETNLAPVDNQVPDERHYQAPYVPAYEITQVNIPEGLTTITLRRDVLAAFAECLQSAHPGCGPDQYLQILGSLGRTCRVIGDLQFGQKRGEDISASTGTPFSRIATNYIDGEPITVGPAGAARPTFRPPYQQNDRWSQPRPDYRNNQPNNNGYGPRRDHRTGYSNQYGPRQTNPPRTPRPVNQRTSTPIDRYCRNIDPDSQEYFFSRDRE